MSSLNFPAWVYEMLGAMLEYEEIHGDHKEGWTCFAAALERVPESVRRDALVWHVARKVYTNRED